MKKLVKKVAKFIKCFFMTFYGITIYCLVNWLFIFTANYGIETGSNFIIGLSIFSGIMFLLFLHAIIDGLKNEIYAYKHWNEYK